MHLSSGLLLLLAIGLSVSSATAQTEYFTGGERFAAAGGFVQQGENLDGTGFEVKIAPASRLMLSFGFARSDSDIRISSLALVRPGEIEAWSAAFAAYPRRQGLDGPITFGIGFNGGVTTTEVVLVEPGRTRRFSEDVLAIGVNALVANLITEPDRPFRMMVKAEAGLSVLLTNAEPTYVQSLGIGGGFGFLVGRRALVFAEPAALVSLSGGTVVSTFVGTLGLAYAF